MNTSTGWQWVAVSAKDGVLQESSPIVYATAAEAVAVGERLTARYTGLVVNAVAVTVTDDTYEGWTNRETWAVALHINNDQGWQESVHESLRDAWATMNAFDLETANEWDAGRIIRENVEQVLTVDGHAEVAGEDHLPAELSRIAEDIGSLWRVDWTALGASFLSDLAEMEA